LSELPAGLSKRNHASMREPSGKKRHQSENRGREKVEAIAKWHQRANHFAQCLARVCGTAFDVGRRFVTSAPRVERQFGAQIVASRKPTMQRRAANASEKGDFGHRRAGLAGEGGGGCIEQRLPDSRAIRRLACTETTAPPEAKAAVILPSLGRMLTAA
jgi:hypothetical protein